MLETDVVERALGKWPRSLNSHLLLQHSLVLWPWMRNFKSLWIAWGGCGWLATIPRFVVCILDCSSSKAKNCTSDSCTIKVADANDVQPIRCTGWDLEGRSQVEVIFLLLVCFLLISKMARTWLSCDGVQHPSSTFHGFWEAVVAAVVVSWFLNCSCRWLLNSNSVVTSGFLTFLTEAEAEVPLVGQLCSVLEHSLHQPPQPFQLFSKLLIPCI